MYLQLRIMQSVSLNGFGKKIINSEKDLMANNVYTNMKGFDVHIMLHEIF